ncbi:MAG: arginyltransferase [Gammaproteobacteria bacterium]|nr:arginyltransferase [Gammaproteobacteria bacterium]
MTQEQKLSFYATPPHDCNYLPGQDATTLFADPRFPKDTRLYSALADCGFRRSGEHLYTPHCDNCSSCVPIRIPVQEFKPSRNQKRNIRQNQDLSFTSHPSEFRQEHFELFEKYLAQRHTGGGMDNPTQDSYLQFLTASWAETEFFEMRVRESKQLVGVAIADIMENAISAVYTYFDPEFSARSPGRFAVLAQIEEARKRELSWVYLGYWIKDCRKMSYKTEYQPMEYYRNNDWYRDP